LGRTPLAMAIWRDRLDIVQELLQGGANSEKLNEGLLSLAAKKGDLQKAASLIESGVSLNAWDDMNSTPLVEAITSEQLEMVRYLLRSGADVNFPTWDGYTPLMLASSRSNSMIFHTILDARADVNAKTDKPTALMAAAEGGHREFVRSL